MSAPIVTVDLPLSPALTEKIAHVGELRLWDTGIAPGSPTAALFTYGHPPVADAMLAALPELKVISNFGVGVDHIDVAAAAARGIPVGNTPGAVDGSTADMTMALILAAPRRLAEGERMVRARNWTGWTPTFMLGNRIWGKRQGIKGMGRIGQAVERRPAAACR